MSKTHHPLFKAENPSATQTPTVTTTLTLMSVAGAPDGLLSGTFQGYNPPVDGSLVLALGATADKVPGHDPHASALKHVLAGTPVSDPTVLADLNFSTPGHGPEGGTVTDVAIAATTPGFAYLTAQLGPALAGTALGRELQPLVNVAGVLLPGFTKDGGEPKGGSTTAAPWFATSLGVGVAQTLTLLGVPTVTSANGSLIVNDATGPAAVTAAQDTAYLLGNASSLLSDVQSGNIAAALLAGAATLQSGAALGTALVPLLADAVSQHNPTLPAIHDPILSLDLNTRDTQSFGLGIGTPTQVSETLNVQVTADKFGDYALGKLLAEIAPQLVKDLSGGTTQTAESIFAQLAQGVSTLAQGAANGYAGTGGAAGVPSSLAAPDIAISASLVTTENQNLVAGSASNSQTFAFNFESNAQGFFDLGNASQSALTAVLVGLLETPGGQEALQIGGEILTQIDKRFGPAGTGGMDNPIGSHYAHLGMM